jgi:potassium uptake TrkH family protein
LVALSFAVLVVVGTLVLLLPVMRAGPAAPDLLTAFFTATSAVTVTGLSTVSVDEYWSPAGQGVILALIQVGGLGILTVASVSLQLVGQRLGLRRRLEAQTEGNLGPASVSTSVGKIIAVALVVEALTVAALTGRYLTKGLALDDALWEGTFHGVSAFTGAGFALRSSSFIPDAHDPWVLVPVSVAALVGSIGFPVVFELLRRVRPKRWSLHTKLTLSTTGALFGVGAVLLLALEWANDATLGPKGVLDKVGTALFHSLMPRSAGFNSLDMGQARESTLLVTDILMFIGGGSASTAGGIKVTTFALLAAVILAELRGHDDTVVFSRRVPPQAVRQALVVALVSLGAVVSVTLVLEATTPFTLSQTLFETTSAFSTNGLSTGITADLPPHAQVLLALLMYLGRVGPLTLGAALALRSRRVYRHVEERPLLG